MVARATIFLCQTDEDALAAVIGGAVATASGGDVVAVSDAVAAVFVGAMAAVATCGLVVAMPSTDVKATLSTVEILEEKVLIQLWKLENHDNAKIWIMDTGATNHMSSSCAAFAKLDTSVQGTVRFRTILWQELKVMGRCNLSARMARSGSLKVCTTFSNS
jgi:hypothetical protein